MSKNLRVKLLLLFILAFVLAGKLFAQSNKIEPNRLLTTKNSKYGLTDSLNKTVVPFIYDFIEYKNKRLLVRKNGLQGLLTTSNELILPVEYVFVLPKSNNRFILWTPRSVFGLCDNDGKIILPVKYRNISSSVNDDFYITRNDKNLNGVYRFTGENVLPEIYRFFTIDGYKVFAINDAQPIILNLQSPNEIIYLDKKMSFVETSRHHSIGEQFYQIVKIENKYGLINSSNRIIIPFIYDQVKSSQHWRYFIIKKDGKLGIINVSGDIVKEPVYDAIELRKEYVLLKRKNQKEEIYSYQ